MKLIWTVLLNPVRNPVSTRLFRFTTESLKTASTLRIMFPTTKKIVLAVYFVVYFQSYAFSAYIFGNSERTRPVLAVCRSDNYAWITGGVFAIKCVYGTELCGPTDWYGISLTSVPIPSG